ncbi:hypothetical protein crov339 [Cafeteria roenbergensis virus]|uniref:Uncharacterized protein n=1 Tax=Cafeteria roenbergensis virus (strain BV-PW1) TaxID=693272 RepID=E3T5B0_CROVB|nr:hypothetical protein crov339 [Cafeteria roenbergensis virus BV-PW1]ADO67373.1 hypothetical protein crov339 [Cafeteria roenbergensis virus BV-PW1]
MSNTSKTDYLNVDPEMSGQKYVCLSFLTPTKEDQTSLTGIKVRGVFDDYEDACKKAKNLQEMDPAFNVFVGEVGKWLPFNPDPDSKYVKNSEYADGELNNIMKNYLVNQEKAKIFHEKRKHETSRKMLEEDIAKLNTHYNKTQTQLKKTEGSMKETLESRMKTLNARIKETELKIKKHTNEENKYNDEIKKLDNSSGPSQMNLEPPRNLDV